MKLTLKIIMTLLSIANLILLIIDIKYTCCDGIHLYYPIMIAVLFLSFNVIDLGYYIKRWWEK